MVSILNLRIEQGSSILVSDIGPIVRPVWQGKIEGIMRTPTYREIGVKIETTVSQIIFNKPKT